MENEMLSNIHYDYVQSEEYGKSTELKNINAKCTQNYDKITKIVGKETFREIEDFVTEVNYECEYNGFLMGFKYAVRLMSECGLALPSCNNK